MFDIRPMMPINIADGRNSRILKVNVSRSHHGYLGGPQRPMIRGVHDKGTRAGSSSHRILF
jgi:hypothetical protein